jgi:hypothetical protein
MPSEEELKSYETEAQFERRVAFGNYGLKAIMMMIDKGSGDPEMEDSGISNAEFETKYGYTKQGVNLTLWKLQIAVEKQDFKWRNEAYDFFIDMLDNAS